MPRDPWDNAVIVDSDDPWDNAVVVDDEEDEDEPSFLERAGRFGMKTASYTPIPLALNLISKGAGDALVGAHEKAVMKGLSSGLSGLADLGRGIGDAFSPDTRDVELEAGDFAGREPGQAGAITRGGAGRWLDDIAGGIDRFAGRVTGSEGLAAGEADLARIGKGKWYDVPGELISNPKALASLAGSATGSLGSTMAMGTVGKVAPLIGIGLQELHGVEEAQRAEEEALGRNIAPGERLLRQLGTSGFITALERIVPDELMKAAKGARGGAARALLTPVKEGATEGAQRAIADIWGTPEGVFDPTGTALEFGGGLLGGAALGPMHLGKGGQDLPEAPPRDHLREVLDFRQNLNDFKAAKAQRFFNEAHEKKKETLASLIEQEKVANAALAAEPTPKNRAQAFDIDAQRKALEAEIAQEEAGPRQLEPGARPSPKPTHVRDLTVQEEILLDRGTPKLGQARGGGATIGFRDEGHGAGRGVEEIAQTVQRWAQQDKAIPLDLIDIHDSVFDPAYYDQLSDSEKAEVEKARARGIEDAAISRATGTPGFYGQDGRIHVLAPRISNLGHLYDLITGHEGTHLAADESRGGAPDSAVAPEFYGASPEQRMRTQAALAKRAKGKDVLAHALRPYAGSSEAVIAEEALANAAEMAPTQKAPGRIDEAIAAVRTALRGNSLLAPFVSKASDAEIRVILKRARQRLESRVRGGGATKAAPPASPSGKPGAVPTLTSIGDVLAEAVRDNVGMREALVAAEGAIEAGDGDTALDALSRFLAIPSPEAPPDVRLAPAQPKTQEPVAQARPTWPDVDAMLEEQRRNDDARAEAQRKADEEYEAAKAREAAAAEASAKAERAPLDTARVSDEQRRRDQEQAERDAKVKLQREREAAQQQEVVGGFPVAGADVLSSIAERGAVSPKPQERIPEPVAPIPVDTLIARTEEKNTKKATGKAPSPTPPPSVPPVAGPTTTTAPPGKAPKKKVRHSIRTRFGYEERERALDDYSLPDEQRRATEDPEHWVRYAVPETASFPSDSAITSAKTTLRQFGITLDRTTPLEGVGKNGVWTKPTQAGSEVIITTWPDGRPAYAWSLNGKTVAWAAKFPGGQPVAKPSPETKTEKLARLLEQTDPSHPFRVMQGELAKRGVMRDPTTDALSEGGLATAELMAPADSFVKKFRRWAIDPRPIIGRVRYEHGDHAAMTEDQIRTGLEQLRRGYFGMPEAHAINMLALDEERKELERYNKGGKIRTAEEAFRGADEARRMVGQTGAAEQAPEGLGRASVPGAGEGLVAGTPERGEAGRAGGRELPTARADAGVEERPFPEAEEPLPPFEVRYSMAGASAKTADRKELSRAQRMVRGGISDEETWRQTGWRRFPDGRWRFEISDHDAKLNEDVYKTIPFEHQIKTPKVTLGDLLSHDALFAAYPGLRDMRVYRADGGGEGAVAAIDKKTNEIFLYEGINKHPEGPLSFILHEIQHAIQETEGFAKGGSPETVSRSVPESEARQYAEAESRSLLESADQIEEEAVKQESRATLLAPYSEKIKRAIEAQRDGRTEEAEAIRAEIYESVDKDEDMPLGWADEIRRSASVGATSTSVLRHADYLRRRAALMREDAEKARAATGSELQRYVDLHADTYEFYKRLAGEAEARQTQARLNLTPEERRARDPYLDFDVEPDRQLVDRRRYSVRGEPVTGPDGVRRLTIFHMSNRDDLEEIDPKFQGTAQAGAEMKRRYDEGFEPFSNWYTGEPGTVVEAHRFGGKPMYESEVELTNEPGGVIEAGRIEGRTAAQLKAEGYTGIYFPSHGQVQMFAPVRPAPVGTAPRPGRPVARGDEFYREATGREARYSRRDPSEAQISWEALPGKSTGWLRGIHAAPYEIRAAFTADMDAKVLRDSLGRDRIARLFGVDETETVVAPGYWKGERNPSRQLFVRVPDGPDGLEKVKAYAAARGYVLRQEAMGVHLARNPQAGERVNGYHADIGRMPTTSEYADFIAGVNRAATAAEKKRGAFVPVPTHAGINMWTWDDSISTDRLREVYDAAFANIRGDVYGTAHPLVVDSELVENNWQEAPNGEAYAQRFTPSAGSPGVQSSLDQLRSAADKVGRQWAARHGWGTKLGSAEPGVPRDLEPLISRDVNPGLKGARRTKLFQDIARLIDGRALADMKFAAESGRAMKGWYRESWQSIRKLFGEDAERFAGLLAALSPQQGVKENLRMAVDAWQTWVEAGRPADRASVEALFPVVGRKWSSVQKRWINQYATVDMEARFNNAITALTDPGAELSGDKVESFRRNLRGDFDAVTNDTWMAYFSEWQQKVFATETGYLAGSYLVRRAAKKLGWTPAEVQETVWTFFRELVNRTGVGGTTAADVMATMTQGDVVSGSDSFAHLVRDPDVQKRLSALGLDVNSLPDLPRLSAEEAATLAVRPEDRDSGVSRRVAGRAQRQADSSWARGEIQAAGVAGLEDADPAALRKLATALGIPTEGRGRNETIAALRAYADPVRYSRRPAVPFDFTRSTGPADIPLDVPQVESRVDKLVEGEGYLLHQGADYTPTSLKRDTTQSQDDVEQKSRRLDMTITDDKWVSLVNRKDRVLSATEQMAINARVALREAEMNDATTRRIEAERMSEADRKAKGLDVQTLIREEIDATLGYVAMQKASINAGTEAGRALAARKRIMAAGTELTPDMLTRKLLKEIPNASSKDVADLFQKYRTGDMAAFREGVRDAMAPGWARKYMEYFRGAGLLSGIGTHVANFTGNIGEPAFRLAETMYAAGADKVYSTLTGRPRERFLGEAKYELQGQLAAIPAAFGKFTSALYHQILLQEEPDVELSGKFDHQVGAISGKKGTLIRTSFRALGVADDFFKELGFAAALQKRAYREARREGLTGTAAEKRALEIANEGSMDPTGRWRSLMEAVAKERLERVFQEDPAKAVQSVMRITHDHPLLGLIVPFVKTPANITRAGWRRSPMGLLLPGDFWTKSRKYAAQQEALRAGKKVDGELVSRGEVEDSLARASVGTTLAVAFGALAAAGLMTGGGPTDDDEKKAKRATGWQPYSFVIPGAGEDGKPLYVPYGRFEPASSLMGIVADAFELSDERHLLDKVLTSVATNWTNKTFFKGLNDAAQAIYRPQIAAKNWLGSTVAAHVPNIVAKGAEALDPTFRDRRSPSGLTGLGEFTKRGVLRRIPGASNTLEPMYSVTGEESPRPGNAFTRFVLPIQASSERPGTELEAYMAKIHEVPGDVPRELVIPKALLPRNGGRDWTGTRIHVTDAERAFLAKARRDAASQLRRQLTSLQQLPIDTQRKRIRDTFRDAQERAIRQLWARSQGLRERAREKVTQ